MKTEFPRNEIYITPATIRYTFDKQNTSICKEHGDLGSINITDILTRIIQDTGRFTENWASDCLYTIAHIRNLCENTYPLEQEIDEIYCLGIRKNGVDHNAYIMNQLMQSQRGYLDTYVFAEPYYRRILAVRVHVFKEDGISSPRVECELKDLTTSFHQINKADLDENGKLIPDYPNGNPVPFDPYAESRKQKEGETACDVPGSTS